MAPLSQRGQYKHREGAGLGGIHIFISYRRSDSAGHARALHGDLRRRFESDSIFFDRDSIESGAIFPDTLAKAVKECRVLLALIAPGWLDPRDPAGRRRLDDPADFVRREIAGALAAGKTVIPVLFDDTSMPAAPHFLTCTVMEWLPVFTRPATVAILLDSWRYLREHDGFRLYGYVVLENHCHFVAQAPRLDHCVARFKSFTARRIIDHLQEQRAGFLLDRLRFSKRAHKDDRDYQFWQEGSHAELIQSEAMMREKLDYIHYNPVKRGYVDRPEHWRYSSARNYAGVEGLIGIDRWGGGGLGRGASLEAFPRGTWERWA